VTISQQNVPDSDHQLIQQHLRNPAGAALNTLITRHLPLVHSVARRISANDEAARDISQTVFLRLVKKAKKIPPTLPLTAWFHRETHSAAVDHVRSEARRQRREQTAVSLDAMNNTSEPWDQLAPEIDGAINELSEGDRSLVLLRFYQDKTHPQIASELGIKEDAARMRTNRALEKLRAILTKRGITTSSALLATTLPGHAVSPAPAALASSIAAALPNTATTSTLGFLKIHFLTLGTLALGAPLDTTPQVKINRLEGALETAPLTSQAPSSSRPSSVGPRSISSKAPDLLSIFANPDPAERLQLLQQFGTRLSIHQIPQTLDLLRQKTPEWDGESKMLTHLLLTRWTKADPEAAFDLLNQANFTLERGHPTSILATLASLDPRRTADWLADPTNAQAYYPVLGHILAGTIAKEWARQAPDAALAWAKSLPNQQQAGAFSGILGTIASTDPQQASTLALALDPGDARDHILSEIATSWARQAPTQALAWADELAAPEKKIATKAALHSWSITEPEKTARYLDQQGATEHFDLVAGQWARHHPAQAADWVVSKPQSPQQHQALGEVLWNWTTQNPGAAASWVENQPEGTSRDHAIAGLTAAATNLDPRTALSWAQKISDATLRTKMVRHTIDSWAHQDPKSALEWSDEHRLQSND
jgi:RNA polymerase sigma factor (sigma-70 family)